MGVENATGMERRVLHERSGGGCLSVEIRAGYRRVAAELRILNLIADGKKTKRSI